MKNEITTDLRFDAVWSILIDQGVSYQPSISGIVNLDSNYTLTIGNVVKTVLNEGLTLTADGIVIVINENDFPKGEYKGYLVSDSKQAGIYKNIEIKLNVR